MSAVFITRDVAGKTLIDSRYIAMGLVKSGYFQLLGSRPRWQLKGSNANPNNPSHWETYGYNDPVYGFSVTGICPVAYVAGRAMFMEVVRSGDTFTYYYANASTSCRFYVFDLMRDRGPGAKLILRNREGSVTFDSLQIPLNIASTAQAPLPPRISTTGFLGMGTNTCYIGGNMTDLTDGNVAGSLRLVSEHRHATGLVDCAAVCPWSRGMAHTSKSPWAESYSGREAAYGSGGDLVFIMGTDAGARVNQYFNQFGNPEFGGNPGTTVTFMGIPTDRLPVATAIETQGLPIPFDIAA